MQSFETYTAVAEAKIHEYQKEARLHHLSQQAAKSSLRKTLANTMRFLADKLEPVPQPVINERML